MDLTRYTVFNHIPSQTFTVYDNKLKRELTEKEVNNLSEEYERIKQKQPSSKEEILETLKQEANKTKDKSTEFTHGKSCGKIEAYSHAYFLVKKFL